MSRKVITINRMYGSNGRKIGKLLADALNIHFYDKELIRIASEQKGIPYEELLKVDEKRASQWRYPVESEIQMQPQYHFYPMNDVLFATQSEIITELAKQEDCVIVGRCANHILGDQCRSVFIFAPFDVRVKNIEERLGRNNKSARSLVKKMDKERRIYYEYFTDCKWTDMTQYDLCIDSSRFSLEEIVKLLKNL